MDQRLQLIYESVLEGDMVNVQARVQGSISQGVPVEDILNDGLISAMSEIGRLFEAEELFVPEMLMSARAMKAGLDIIRPLLVDSGVEPVGKVALGTVQGDMHDIGKNLVGMMLEGAGYEIVDLGTDVSPERFVAAVQNGAEIIGLSALLTTTMGSMGAIIEAIRKSGLRDRVKIIIGGAPVTSEFAERIGADGFAPDASQAVKVVKALMA
jgi:5-methyltetrahydrofolate--homocysteine methyltransferase